MSGATLQEGDTVTLVLSKGPMKGNIPNVVGLTLGEAGNILKENKLSLGNIKYEYSDTYNNGIVISQDPKSGSENNQEWGTVNVVVSKGQKEEVIQTCQKIILQVETLVEIQVETLVEIQVESW